jgi:hypothetical protein
MNKFVFKTNNYLLFNYYLQRKCLAVKTPAAINNNSNSFIDSEKSRVNGTIF